MAIKMAEKLDELEQCRNCRNWKNKEQMCMGKCQIYNLNTYANYWCDKFSFGKVWSERVKTWETQRFSGKEPLGNMPFIDQRGAPDI